MFQEFKTFIARGNVLDLAVAVVIGAAFGAIVTSFTEDLINPVIGMLTGGVDFSGHFVALGSPPADYKGSVTDYEALKKAGVPLLGYGKFLSAIIRFVIVAFAIFLLVKAANRVMKPAEAAAPEPTASEKLLAEIRDALKAPKP